MDGALIQSIWAGLSLADLIDLLVETLGILALLLALSALRAKRRRRETPELEEEAAQLRAKVAELNSRLTTVQSSLSAEVRMLRDRIARLGLESELLPEAVEVPKTIESGLKKTRQSFFFRLRNLIRDKSSLAEEFFAGLEELLISSDLGVKTTEQLIQKLRQRAKSETLTEDGVRAALKADIREILSDSRPAQIVPTKRSGMPLVILVVGVNGVGKTTTIAKLAHLFVQQGKRVLLAAGDTFRAAAGEQLDFWAKRSGADILAAADDAKPSTVAYQAVHRAKGKNCDVLIIDTAGRLHTRVNLMNELSSVVQIVAREQPGAPHETLLILDASTGQNALQQAKEFNEVCKLTGLIVTKLDGTPKGGIVVAVKSELGIPIRYVGVGEGIDDLKVFSAEEFTEALLIPETPVETAAPTERAKTRRRKKRGEESQAE